MIEFRLLGSLDLKGSEGETLRSVLAQPKRVALLAYLAVARPNGYHRRDKLLGLFWSESDQERGRGALRKALYLLRQSLGEEVVISRGDEEVGLADGALWCDATAFEEALEAGETREALEVYRGDLLEGFFIADSPEFERWLEGERARLRRRAAEAAWTLVDEAEAAENGVEAARWARKAVSLSPNDEAAFRRLLELLDRLGDRTGAIEEYEAFARHSREEYEAEPSPETQTLIAAIRERDVVATGGRAEGLAEVRGAGVRAISVEPVADTLRPTPHVEPVPTSLRRVLTTYALVSLAVLVAVHIFTLQLGLPDWVFPSAVVVLLVGLPLIVGTALVRGEISTSLGAVALALMTLVLVAAAVIVPRVLPPSRSPSAGGDAISSTTVAVFPFAVRGTDELAYLREGMVDLLSTALDGAGELRSVDPQALLGFVERTQPVTGPEQAGRVASHFGAGLYVLGSIVAAGGRIQLSAALYDLEGSVVRRAETRIDDESQLIGVVDDLTRQLLAAGVGGPGTRLSTLATLTTQSLAALKEYLRGENAYRVGQLDSAVAAYRRAVAADSTFALGYFRLAVASDLAFVYPVNARAAIRGALPYENRLANRDRALVEAYDAYLRGSAAEAERRLRSIVGTYPSDVDAWHALGRLYSKHRPILVRPVTLQRAAFERVLELDPDHVQAHVGLYNVAVMEGRHDEAEALMTRRQELAPRADLALALRAGLAYAKDDKAEQEQVLSELQRADVVLVYSAFNVVAKLADDRRGAIEVATLLTDPSNTPTFQAAAHTEIAHMYLAMGRWAAAKSALEWTEPPEANPRWSALATRATLAASLFLPVPSRELEELRNSLMQLAFSSTCASTTALTFPCPAIWGRVSRPYLAGLLSAKLADYDAAETRARELEAFAAAPDNGELMAEWAALAHDRALSVRAHVAWNAGRSQQALQLLDQMEPERWWWALGDFGVLRSRAPERYLRAELLRELGRDEESLIWYESLTGRVLLQVYLAPTHFRRAEIYERFGNREEAARHYRRVIEIWQDCDPELRPMVEQAEQRLARLDSGSG